MSATAASGQEERRAALMLHALEGADRDWLLQRLAPRQRERLQPMLAELRALGIPADRAIVQQAILSPAAPVQRSQDVDAAAPAAPRDPADVLAAADPAVLASVLAGEPAELVAQLLRVQAWPWRAPLLARLPAGHRQQVRDELAQPAGPAAPAMLQAALVAAVVRRLPEPGPAPEPRAFVRWLHNLKARA